MVPAILMDFGVAQSPIWTEEMAYIRHPCTPLLKIKHSSLTHSKMKLINITSLLNRPRDPRLRCHITNDFRLVL